MSDRVDKAGGGLRERKKRDTKRRITETGIALFLQHGIEQTTLDDIASAAGISRRTFFYYFTSKDDILLSLLSGMGDQLSDALKNAPAGSTPIEAVRDAVIGVCDALPANDMIELDRLMRTSASVQARKQAFYVEQEGAIYAALKERWPEPERSTALRTVAMISVGAFRLASDIFSQERGARPIRQLLEDIFGSAAKEMRLHP